MPAFRKLNNIVRDIADKVSGARNIPSPDAKVEHLLAARDEAHERFLNLERRMGDVGFAGFLGFFPGMGMMLAGATGFLAAPSVAAVGLMLATPLFMAGLAIAGASAVAMLTMGKAVDRLRDDRDTIEKRINREVLNIAKNSPKEAEKSRRYLSSLVRVYNAAAEGDTAYERMLARVRRNKAPAPAAA